MNNLSPSAGTQAAPLSCVSPPETASAVLAAAKLLLPHLERGVPVDAAILRVAMETAFGAADASGAWQWKAAYEACEVATVLLLRKHGKALFRKAGSPAAALPLLARIASLLPTHTRRSEASQAFQQFSTPIPLGLAALAAAAITPADRVLEPSAGTGLLAILAEIAGGALLLNEFATTRADLLASLFPAAPLIPEDEKKRARETGEEAQTIPFLKRFTVFNAAQCEGLPEDVTAVAPPPPPGLIEPRVEALIKATGIDFRIGGSRAFYVPAQDYVMVPPPQAYYEPINWHRTALHELGHATGHAARLARDLTASFGSKKYAFEELVAEMNAAFCCASLGIVPTVRHADYIASWLEVLREDNRAIIRAASQASKAAEWLLAFLPADEPAADRDEASADRRAA